MRRSKSDYSGYRGRRTLSDNLRLTALGLAVVALLVVAGLIFAQRYLVYSDDGLRLELPFGSSAEGNKPLEPGDVSVVIRPAGSQSEGEQPQEPAKEAAMAAVELPLSAVLNGTAAADLEKAGANALILEMKGTSGKLAWDSGQTLAQRMGAVAGDAAGNTVLEEWNRGEVYTIARVCCFRDDLMPYQRNDMALRATYGNWRDELGLRWLNPDSQAARQYLADLCGELARLGFDEILLECAAFPVLGNRESIVQSGSYVTGEYTAAVRSFLDLVNAQVAAYDTVLSVRLEEGALTGADAVSGLTPDLLETGADRLWMVGGETALLDLLEQAGIQEGERRLVLIGALTGESDMPRAQLN